MIGKIHSFESTGLVDGPGIRNVIFLQGCSLNCLYCHNPDTWLSTGGFEISSEDLIKKIYKFKSYFAKTGGVTFSGGEPLLQPEFLLDMLQKCKQANIHTCIDTAGVGHGNYGEILNLTDLVILDIKHIDNNGYLSVTGKGSKKTKEFLDATQKAGTKLWIRHVVVPGITDSEDYMKKLANIIKNIKNVEKIELLPYHTLGVYKYKALGVSYKLKDIPGMDKIKLENLYKYLIAEIGF